VLRASCSFHSAAPRAQWQLNLGHVIDTLVALFAVDHLVNTRHSAGVSG
jgi:hypothetical protein